MIEKHDEPQDFFPILEKISEGLRLPHSITDGLTRRYKRALISWELMPSIFFPTMDRYVNLVTPLPKDIHIFAILFDPAYACFVVYLRSEEFDVVPEHLAIPILNLTYSVTEAIRPHA